MPTAGHSPRSLPLLKFRLYDCELAGILGTGLDRAMFLLRCVSILDINIDLSITEKRLTGDFKQ